MSSFPAFLSLRHRPVLVIGGGENAARKIRLLLHSEAAVTVLALELNAELNGLAVSGAIQHRAEAFTPAALTGFVIVISADTAVNEAVAEAARARGFSPADDNEADAIAILLWALETRGGVQ